MWACILLWPPARRPPRWWLRGATKVWRRWPGGGCECRRGDHRGGRLGGVGGTVPGAGALCSQCARRARLGGWRRQCRRAWLSAVAAAAAAAATSGGSPRRSDARILPAKGPAKALAAAASLAGAPQAAVAVAASMGDAAPSVGASGASGGWPPLVGGDGGGGLSHTVTAAANGAVASTDPPPSLLPHDPCRCRLRRRPAATV